jgi:hypothetical protein
MGGGEASRRRGERREEKREAILILKKGMGAGREWAGTLAGGRLPMTHTGARRRGMRDSPEGGERGGGALESEREPTSPTHLPPSVRPRQLLMYTPIVRVCSGGLGLVCICCTQTLVNESVQISYKNGPLPAAWGCGGGEGCPPCSRPPHHSPKSGRNTRAPHLTPFTAQRAGGIPVLPTSPHYPRATSHTSPPTSPSTIFPAPTTSPVHAPSAGVGHVPAAVHAGSEYPRTSRRPGKST